MKITGYTTEYLLHCLEREYPGYDCTLTKCESTTCIKGARGYFCSECITGELCRRAGVRLAVRLNICHEVLAQAHQNRIQLEQQILEAAR